MTSDDDLIEILKKEAQERIKEHQKLKKEKMEEFTNIKDGIIKQLNYIEKKIELLSNQEEKHDKLISLYRELEQAQGQLTQNRRQEICFTVRQFIECRNVQNQISYHYSSSKIQGILTYLQVTQQSMESLSKLENDQQEVSEGLRKKVKLEVQDYSTLTDQIQRDQIIEQICTSKIGYQSTYSYVGHQDWATKVAISYDDKYIASGDNCGYIILWDLKVRSILKQYIKPIMDIDSLSFSKNNLRLAAGRYNQFIFIYDIGDLKKNDPIQVLKGHSNQICRTIFTNNSDYLISCSRDKTVRIWDVDQQDEIARKDFTNQVLGVCLSEDEELIGCCCNGGLAYLLDSKLQYSLGQKVKWKAHKSQVNSIEIIKKSKQILTSSNAEIRFWSVDGLLNDKKKKYFKEINLGENTVLNRLWIIKAIPVSDPKVIIAGSGETIKIWQIVPTEMKQEIEIKEGKYYLRHSFAITSDFKTIIAASEDKQLKVYQTKLI